MLCLKGLPLYHNCDLYSFIFQQADESVVEDITKFRDRAQSHSAGAAHENSSGCWNFRAVKLRRVFNAKSLDNIFSPRILSPVNDPKVIKTFTKSGEPNPSTVEVTTAKSEESLLNGGSGASDFDTCKKHSTQIKPKNKVLPHQSVVTSDAVVFIKSAKSDNSLNKIVNPPVFSVPVATSTSADNLIDCDCKYKSSSAAHPRKYFKKQSSNLYIQTSPNSFSISQQAKEFRRFVRYKLESKLTTQRKNSDPTYCSSSSLYDQAVKFTDQNSTLPPPPNDIDTKKVVVIKGILKDSKFRNSLRKDASLPEIRLTRVPSRREQGQRQSEGDILDVVKQLNSPSDQDSDPIMTNKKLTLTVTPMTDNAKKSNVNEQKDENVTKAQKVVTNVSYLPRALSPERPENFFFPSQQNINTVEMKYDSPVATPSGNINVPKTRGRTKDDSMVVRTTTAPVSENQAVQGQSKSSQVKSQRSQSETRKRSRHGGCCGMSFFGSQTPMTDSIQDFSYGDDQDGEAGFSRKGTKINEGRKNNQ